jgi:hypothetical protein
MLPHHEVHEWGHGLEVLHVTVDSDTLVDA